MRNKARVESFRGFDLIAQARVNTQFKQMGIGKVVSTAGFVGARAVLSVPGTGNGMDIGPWNPLTLLCKYCPK